jgi:tetratricopeptide (TPR) repeat protein
MIQLIIIWGFTVISLVKIWLNLNDFFKSLNCLLKLIWLSVSNPHIIISCIIVRINLNGFFISLNCKKTVEEYLLEGNQNYHKGEFKKAIEAYEKAIDIKPDEEAYHNMGIAYIMLNEKVSFEDAIKAYEKAIEINPDYDTALAFLKASSASLNLLNPA